MGGYRSVAALLLIVVGAVMIVRGVTYSMLGGGPGWKGAALAVLIGSLVIALGLARWRYWHQK